jgi:hypothetical protein
MLNRTGNYAVCDTGEGTSEIILTVRKIFMDGLTLCIVGFKPAASLVEGAELDTNLIVERQKDQIV